MKRPNKWNNYAKTYVEEIAPTELKEDYAELLELIDTIKKLEFSLAYAKIVGKDTIKQIEATLKERKTEYTILHTKIVKEKKRLGVTCTWEKMKL